MVQLQSEVRRLEGELDTVRRERDTLQLEMSLVQVSSRFLGGFCSWKSRSEHTQ